MDLVSVYRDAIAIGTARPVRAGQRGDPRRPRAAGAGQLHARAQPARIDAIFTAREQMLEFNVPAQLALESMMVALKAARGRPGVKRAVADRCVVAAGARPAMVIGAGWSLARPIARCFRRRPTSRQRRPRPDSGGPAHAHRGADAALQRFYDQKLDWSPCERRRVRDARGAARLRRPRPARRSRSPCCATRPTVRAGRLLVVNPGGPGAPGTDYAASNADDAFGEPIYDASTSSASTRAAPAQRAGRLPERRRARRLRHRPTPTPTPRRRSTRVRRLGRRVRPGCPSAPATSPATSPRSRPPATWTSCAPRSASQLTTSAPPTAPSSARPTPTCSRRAGRPVRARRRGRPVALPRGARSSRRTASSRARGLRRPLPRRRPAASSATPSRGRSQRIRASSTRSTPQPLKVGTASSRSATRSTASSRRSTTATTGPTSTRPSAPRFDGDGRQLLGSPTSTPRAVRRRLLRQQLRGDLRDQLPRRPDVDPAGRGPGEQFPAFEKESPTFGRVFAWGCRLRGSGRQGTPKPPPTGTSTPRARRRSSWSARPATRPRRTEVGAGPRPRSSTPGC
jgi:hypothetical protein